MRGMMLDRFHRTAETRAQLERHARGKIFRMRVADNQCGPHVEQIHEISDRGGVRFARLDPVQIPQMLTQEHGAPPNDRNRRLLMPAERHNVAAPRFNAPTLGNPQADRRQAPTDTQRRRRAADHANDCVVRRTRNATVVIQHAVQPRAKTPRHVRRFNQHWLFADVGARGDERPAEFPAQPQVQRRIGQHRPDEPAARRHALRQPARRSPLHQHNGRLRGRQRRAIGFRQDGVVFER
jgi:hypothetical protein